MKTSIYIIAIILTSTLSYAQDRIILKDGSEIKSKVNEIEPQTIKYKKFENLNGPSYSIDKEKVVLILYENGTKDMFDVSEQEAKITDQNKQTYSSAFAEVESMKPKDPKMQTSGMGYITSYNYQGYGAPEGVFNFGLNVESYAARKGKLGFGYSFLNWGSFYDDGSYSSDIYTMALGLGPGIYAFSSEDFRLWVGAYGGVYYSFGTTYFEVTGYSQGEEQISHFDIYYNISAIATYMFTERIGIYAKIGYSNIDFLSFGIAWSPKVK